MFPFHSGDQWSFQVSNDVDYTTTTTNNITDDIYSNYQQKVEQDVNVPALGSNILHFNHAHQLLPNNTIIPKSPISKRKQWSGNSLKIPNNNDNLRTSNSKDGNSASGSDVAQKKIMRREIERQRRLEMASLYSSLRSNLPLEYTKGKRSMGDHIAEATKYIKDLEKSVKELGNKRDQLKALCSSSTAETNSQVDAKGPSTSSSSGNDINVSIHTFSTSIEIEICAGVTGETPFPLSKVLEVLSEEGLDVVSCVSFQVNKRWIYVIHCQVEDVTSIDLCQLQCLLDSEIHRTLLHPAGLLPC